MCCKLAVLLKNGNSFEGGNSFKYSIDVGYIAILHNVEIYDNKNRYIMLIRYHINILMVIYYTMDTCTFVQNYYPEGA